MKKISRRSFMKGAAASVAAGAAASVMGMPALAEEEMGEEMKVETPEWLEPEPEIPEDKIVETITVDALVIGGGTGGLECGASLAEKGLKTLILEQFDDVSTLRNDFGAINSKLQQEEGTVVDKAALMNYHVMQNAACFDQRLPKIWAEESGAAIDWVQGVMEKYGAVLLHEGGYESQFGPHTIPKFPTGHSAHFDNAQFPDGRSVMKQYILDNGGEFRFNTKFIKFEHEGHKVTAAIAQDQETEEYYRFVGEKGIVLATGGYQNNPDMLKALQPQTLPLFGAPAAYGAFGDGIKACLWLGAAMDGDHTTMLFDRFGMLPNESPDNWTEFNYVWIGSQPWLKVNLKGERFFNESGLYDYAPHAYASQPGHMCISVFDANYWQNITQFETMGCSRAYPFPNGTPNDGQYSYAPEDFEANMNQQIEGLIEQGIIQKADTLEELAELMGIPADTFVATVERYNELAEKGEDEDFYKEAYRMIPLKTAPFYAFRNSCMALCTLDGIRINTHMRPIDDKCVAFDGLYVIGDSSGSFFAHSYPNLVTGYAHGRTCTFARRVAREMAGEEVKDYTIMATQDAVI